MPRLYGMMAEFGNPQELLAATRAAREHGYRKMDAYSPMPVHGLAEALGSTRTWVPPIVLLGGLTGGASGFFLQYWINVIDYPINVGGRPLNSWPSFIPVTFEMTILFAAFAAVIGMLALNRLPMPYHPVFNAPRFSAASQDRFFLCIEAGDARYHRVRTREFFESQGALDVVEVDE